MDKTIEFKTNISILVGINGAGKTSVLNIINWLLRPNINELCTIEFEKITLKFLYKGNDFLITCEQNKVELTIDLENITQKVKYSRIQATFKIHPKKITKNDNLKDSINGFYDMLGPEEHEKKTWAFMFDEIPKPIVIGLDRNLYVQEGDEVSLQEGISKIKKSTLRKEKLINNYSPLERVKSLLSIEHNLYRNNVLMLYSTLNEKIMLSAFDEIFTKTNIETLIKSPKPSIDTIEILKTQVIEFLKENQGLKTDISKKKDIQNSVRKVNNYFNNLKNILKLTQNSEKNELLYLTNISQFKKINDLIVEFKQFEEDSKKIYLPLKEFIETVNHFFKDSSKQIYFDKENSEVKFNIIDKDSKIIDNDRNIRNLSSGEKQILILLTYIKYNSNLNVFIIDEPELSLHPKWQEDFLDSVQKLMPKDSQLIIATHSPEIIGGNKEYCKVLLPYN